MRLASSVTPRLYQVALDVATANSIIVGTEVGNEVDRVSVPDVATAKLIIVGSAPPSFGARGT